MATAPTVPAKTSWLKKLGQDFVKFLGIANKIEKAAEPIVEAILPASTIGFSLFDGVVAIVTSGEQAFAAFGQASNGPAKLQAALGGVIQLFEQYIQTNLPGSAQILASEQWLSARSAIATQYINTVVAFLNSLPASTVTATANGQAVASAITAAQAAMAAATASKTPNPVK